MKALILAAGIGSRLAPLTNNYPKSMVPVNGKPIIFKQIENLLDNGIIEIAIVAGYKSEVLMQGICEKYNNIKIIESVDYLTTNNMYSAYLGMEFIDSKPFIMMNADVFFDSSIIRELLQFHSTNAIVTDIGRYIEEAMKVREYNGRLVGISKTIVKEKALGSSIDVYKFSSEGGMAFFNKCFEYITNKNELKLWSEVAINDIMSEVEFAACPLVGRWFEIDNHDDLKKAEILFAKYV